MPLVGMGFPLETEHAKSTEQRRDPFGTWLVCEEGRWVVMRIGRREETRGGIMGAKRELQERLGGGSVLEATIIRVPSKRIYNSQCRFPILVRNTALLAHAFDFVRYCPNSGARDGEAWILARALWPSCQVAWQIINCSSPVFSHL